MISSSPTRVLELVVFRRQLILLGGIVSAAGAFFLALMTPYLFRSDAIIEVAPPKVSSLSENLMSMPDNSDLQKAAVMVQSPQLLGDVGAELKKLDLDYFTLFPKNISLFDFRTRWLLLNHRVRHTETNATPPVFDKYSLDYVSDDVMVSSLSRHLIVDADGGGHTMKITYEATDPAVAKIVCGKIAEIFLKFMASREESELHKQERLIESLADRQTENVKHLESQLLELIEEYPQLAASSDGSGRGAMDVAKNFLSKQETLARLEHDLEINRKMLSDVSRGVASSKDGGSEASTDIGAKLTQELNELEFRLVQLTKISGYEEGNPQIEALKKRRDLLKSSIASLPENFRSHSEGSEGTNSLPRGSSLKSMLEQSEELKIKNMRLKAEIESMAKELPTENTAFKKVVRINFLFDSLSRELTTNLTLISELYKELQKTQMSVSALSPSVSLLAPPSSSITAVNLSGSKRTLFGFFIGIAALISLLYLIDIIDPKLLSLADLRFLQIEGFGVFDFHEKSISRISYCILSLGLRREATGGPTGCGHVVTLFRNTLPTHDPIWPYEVAKRLTEQGFKIGVIAVADAPEALPPSITERGPEIKSIPSEAVPFLLPKTVDEMRTRLDYVLVVPGFRNDSPMETFLARSSDHFIYGSEIGVTSLEAMRKIRESVTKFSNLEHHALVFNEKAA